MMLGKGLKIKDQNQRAMNNEGLLTTSLTHYHLHHSNKSPQRILARIHVKQSATNPAASD